MVPEIWPGQNRGRKKKKNLNKKNNEANWMVSNSAQLDRRTKQHTQFGVSASNDSRDMGRTKSWRKKKKKKKKKGEKNERRQSHIASPTGIANNKQPNTISLDLKATRFCNCEKRKLTKNYHN